MNLYREILQLCPHSLPVLVTLPENTPLLLAGNTNNGAESPEQDKVP